MYWTIDVKLSSQPVAGKSTRRSAPVGSQAPLLLKPPWSRWKRWLVPLPETLQLTVVPLSGLVPLVRTWSRSHISQVARLYVFVKLQLLHENVLAAPVQL